MSCDAMKGMMERYADAELSSSEAAEFESHLRDCAACMADALGRMKLKQMTRAAGMRYRPTPELQSRIAKVAGVKTRRTWRAIWLPALSAGAAVAVLLVASVAYWAQHTSRERAFTELADLHVSTLASANPVDVVSTDRHTVKPWFAGRIPFSFNLPELEGSGFALAGGRVAYFQHTPAAQLLYTVRKHQISVFVLQEQGGALPISVGDVRSSRLAMQMESWSSGGLRYFIIGDAPASDLRALSDLFKKAAPAS